jgi:hypothetical protein
MTRDSIPDLAVPQVLAAQIMAAAEKQHRPPLGVLRDALQQYLPQRLRIDRRRLRGCAARARIIHGLMAPPCMN